jgi:hypothetical protein
MGIGFKQYHKCHKKKKKMGQLWAKRKANYALKWTWVLNNTTNAKKDGPTMGQNKS